MNALMVALTLSLAGTEGTLDAPGTLSAEHFEVAPRMLLEPAPFPLQMSLFDVEPAVEAPLLDLRPGRTGTLCVAFVLPSFAELTNVEPLRSPVGFDAPSTRPWLTAAPVKSQESLIPWLKDWNQR